MFLRLGSGPAVCLTWILPGPNVVTWTRGSTESVGIHSQGKANKYCVSFSFALEIRVAGNSLQSSLVQV